MGIKHTDEKNEANSSLSLILKYSTDIIAKLIKPIKGVSKET